MGTQLKTVKLRPTNHYLDLLANIQLKGGKVSELCVDDMQTSSRTVSFKHSYEGSDVVIFERIVYNDHQQVTDWEMTVNDSTYKLYEEN